jgi:hypothetical protein
MTQKVFFFHGRALGKGGTATVMAHPTGSSASIGAATNTPVFAGAGGRRCSVCLLYWYKSTSTDAECIYISASAAHSTPTTARQRAAPGTRFAHFTCLTTSKVQIPRTRPQQQPGRGPREATHFDRITSTKVQILTVEEQGQMHGVGVPAREDDVC